MNSTQKMTAARTTMVLGDLPFYGTLALYLKLREDSTCKTAWTDGRTLGFNPDYVQSITHDQCVTLFAHEVDHCAKGHHFRRDGRDLKQWNIACDKQSFYDLREAGLVLPPDVYIASGDEIGKSAEWIYARIGEQPPQGGGNQPQPGQGQGPSQPSQPGQGQPQPGSQGNTSQDDTPDPMGEVRDAPTQPDDDGEPVPTEGEWKQRTAQAAAQAKAMGNMPGGLARSVAESLKPQIDSRSLLMRFFTERATGDYTWTRPNPRYVASGLYLPALESKTLGKVAVMVDTSGSIDNTDLQYGRGIVQDVLDECNPEGVSLWFADTEVCHIERLEKGDPLTWEPQGGGGTDFCAALKAIDEEGEAVCIICITDLDGTLPDVPPSIPTLWLCTTDRIAPFGETVPLQY